MGATLSLGGQTDKSQAYLRRTSFEYNPLTTTIQSRPFGLGKKKLSALFTGTTSSTARFAYLVFNAYNANDAQIMLSTPGLRWAIPIGKEFVWYFSSTSLLTRIDMQTDAAETGTNSLILITGE